MGWLKPDDTENCHEAAKNPPDISATLAVMIEGAIAAASRT